MWAGRCYLPGFLRDIFVFIQVVIKSFSSSRRVQLATHPPKGFQANHTHPERRVSLQRTKNWEIDVQGTSTTSMSYPFHVFVLYSNQVSTWSVRRSRRLRKIGGSPHAPKTQNQLLRGHPLASRYESGCCLSDLAGSLPSIYLAMSTVRIDIYLWVVSK